MEPHILVFFLTGLCHEDKHPALFETENIGSCILYLVNKKYGMLILFLGIRVIR